MPDPDIEISHQIRFEKNPSPMWAFDRETLAVRTVHEAAGPKRLFTCRISAMTVADIHPSEKVPASSSRALSGKD